MIRKMPYADWMAARNELDTIRQEVEGLGLPQLSPMMEQVYNSLVREGSPTVAGTELEYIAEQLSAHPEMRETVSNLSKKLIDFAFAELSPDHLA